MERLLTALVVSLGMAPLFFVGTIKLIDWLNGASVLKRTISFSTSLFIGAGMVVLGFVLVGGFAWLASGRGYLRPVQAVTGLLVAGWGLFGAVFYWNEPRRLDLDHPVLRPTALYFPMNLPYRPRQSTAWSGWCVPLPHKGATTPTGVLLRYRFRLVPNTDNNATSC